MSHTDRPRRSPAAFERLMAQPTPRHERADARCKYRPGLRRRPGAGRKHALVLADRLPMPLIYYRAYTTHASFGLLFGIDDLAVGRDINPLQPLLAGISRIPERRVKLGPEGIRELFFDATERPARRPGRGQREFHSGKKRRHTIKTLVEVAPRTKPPGPGARPRRVRVVAVCPPVSGRMHDKKLYDRSRVVAPPDARRMGDTAYIGTPLEVPTRKPRGGKLADGQKEGNRRISRRRVVAEHGIDMMEVWRVASERYRNPVGRHTLIMKKVAGLHNLMYT